MFTAWVCVRNGSNGIDFFICGPLACASACGSASAHPQIVPCSSRPSVTRSPSVLYLPSCPCPSLPRGPLACAAGGYRGPVRGCAARRARRSSSCPPRGRRRDSLRRLRRTVAGGVFRSHPRLALPTLRARPCGARVRLNLHKVAHSVQHPACLGAVIDLHRMADPAQAERAQRVELALVRAVARALCVTVNTPIRPTPQPQPLRPAVSLSRPRREPRRPRQRGRGRGRRKQQRRGQP